MPICAAFRPITFETFYSVVCAASMLAVIALIQTPYQLPSSQPEKYLIWQRVSDSISTF